MDSFMSVWSVLFLIVVFSASLVVIPVIALIFVPLFLRKTRNPRKLTREKLNVAFLHPDLGIGGAERLVVDAAVGLQSLRGHSVTMFTAHHDPKHCFKETSDGTLRVLTYGDFLPRHFFRMGHVIFATLRNLYVAMCIVLRSDKRSTTVSQNVEANLPFDVIFVDQISASIPLLSLTGAKIVFYCHHPDLLLTPRESLLKRMYRMPMDWLEELTTAAADVTVVNSAYTGSVFKDTFKSIRTTPEILYPSINFTKYVVQERSLDADSNPFFLSINRYERKKNIELAVQSFGALRRALLESSSEEEMKVGNLIRLVIAGGYDPRVHENVEYDLELHQVAEEENIPPGAISFLRSISNEEKSRLMADCAAVLYTPENEHFGIVPIEAMYARRPVIACDSGGPLESILHEETGYLFPPKPESWMNGMLEVAMNPERATRMGDQGHDHVVDKFSLESFTNQLEAVMRG